MERTAPSPKMDRSMLAPMDGSESRLFLAVTFFILADAVSTLAFYLTRTGVERNPVLNKLLGINPFLVYPFLLSIIIPFFVFRFNCVTQQSVALLLILTHSLAAVNNLGITLLRYPLLMRYFGYSPINIQWMSFILGAVYIFLYTLYYDYRHRITISEGIKLTVTNYGAYLLAYTGLNLIPHLWQVIL